MRTDSTSQIVYKIQPCPQGYWQPSEFSRQYDNGNFLYCFDYGWVKTIKVVLERDRSRMNGWRKRWRLVIGRKELVRGRDAYAVLYDFQSS